MEIALTRHAIDRYQQRVKPALTFSQAARELRALIAVYGRLVEHPPGWAAPAEEDLAATRWLLIGDDIALPIKGTTTAISCLTRAGMSASERAYVTNRKRAIRRAHRAKSDDQGRKHRARDAKAQPTRRRRKNPPELEGSTA